MAKFNLGDKVFRNGGGDVIWFVSGVLENEDKELASSPVVYRVRPDLDFDNPDHKSRFIVDEKGNPLGIDPNVCGLTGEDQIFSPEEAIQAERDATAAKLDVLDVKLELAKTGKLGIEAQSEIMVNAKG